MNLNRLFHRGVDVIFDRSFAEKRFDGKRPTGNDEDRHVAEEVAELLRIHRGGRDDQFQILTARHDFTQKSEGEETRGQLLSPRAFLPEENVSVQTSFVRFVHDHSGIMIQIGIG